MTINQDRHRSAVELNAVLDHLGAPVGISRLQASLMLQQLGIRVSAVDLKQSLRLRRLREDQRANVGGNDDP